MRGWVSGFIAGAATWALASAQAPPEPGPAFSVVERTIPDLQDAMVRGRVTSQQLVEQYLARIRQYDRQGPQLNAFIALNPHALETAGALDGERRAGRWRGPLHGIPVAIKDNYETADMPTTAASKALDGFEPKRDAFVVKKLRDAGAVIVGKTNLHELAYGITTVSSLGGQTRNPYDPTRNPGGSSGGTGAAVAASLVAAGLGTDTCGSVRIPAAHNNLWGLRGTIGLSSRDGIIPLAHSQDIGGPIARSVIDLMLMLDATAGPDPNDPSTAGAPVSRTFLGAPGDTSLGNVRVGVLRALFGAAPEDAEVAAVVQRALGYLAATGAEVADVDLPGLADLVQGTSVIAAEFKFDLLDYFARRPGAPVRSLADILKSGNYHPAVEDVLARAEAVGARADPDYRRTLERRATLRETVAAAMARLRVDALAYPTVRRKPARIGEAQAGSNCQLSASTGFPAISMPAGFTDDGLPVGLELLGGAFAEPQLLRIAWAYEQAVHPRRAPRSTP